VRLNAFWLKIIAVFGMITNHTVIALWEVLPWWLAAPMYALGGLTFPIMAFFVVEGYRNTSNLTKYIMRLAVFGIIAAFFHPLVFGMIIFNILFTIIVGLLCLVMYDKMQSRPLFWVLFCLIVIGTAMFDWGIYGVVIILLMHIIRNEKTRRTLPLIIIGLFMLSSSLMMVLSMWALNQTPDGFFVEILAKFGLNDMEYLWVTSTFGIGILVAAFLLKNFNGERGHRAKWLFYIIYPLHLAIIGGIAFALGLIDLSVFNIFGIIGL